MLTGSVDHMKGELARNGLIGALENGMEIGLEVEGLGHMSVRVEA